MKSLKKCSGEVIAPIKYACLAVGFQPNQSARLTRDIKTAAGCVNALAFEPRKRLIGCEVFT